MFEKLLSFTKKVSDLADKPTLNASELKLQFDAAPEELRESFNNLVDALNTPEALSSLTLQNGWTSYQVGTEGYYYKDQLGRVHLQGRFKNGVTTDGYVLAQLPVGYRPVQDRFFNSRNCNALVTSNGFITLYNITSQGDIGIDGLSFRAV
jgi:hypothetical protein